VKTVRVSWCAYGVTRPQAQRARFIQLRALRRSPATCKFNAEEGGRGIREEE